MKKTLIWIAAVVITIATVIYQRKTGPTYPIETTVTVGEQIIEAQLPRTHGGDTDKEIRISVPGDEIQGKIHYRRFRSGDEYKTMTMVREGDELAGLLPHQPPAGKLEYIVILEKAGKEYHLNQTPVVIRFKGAVPTAALIPHILFIFAAELLSLIAGLYVLFRVNKYKLYGWLTLAFLITGGHILGPVIQKFAFGAFWTGFPFGQDLTDNKVLVATMFWIVALVMNFKKERPKYILAASILFFIINMIPHSLFGSELDYESGEVIQGMIMMF